MKEVEFNILNVTSLIAGFIALLFIIFLLTLKTNRRLPNYLLAFYLLLFIQDSLAQYTSKFLYPVSPVAGMMVSESVYLMPSVLYLFFKSSIYRDFTLSWRSVVHLVPYVFINLLLYPGYYRVLLNGRFTEAYEALFYSSFTYKLAYILFYVQLSVYFTLIFLELRRFRQLLKENYSDPVMKNYRWLLQFAFLLLALDLVGLIKNILRFSTPEIIWNYATIIVVINILVFISWVLLMALRDPAMFTGIYSDLQPVRKMLGSGPVEVPVIEAKGNGQSGEEESEDIRRLKEHMESKEPYLDASLSIYDLSSQLGVNVRDLSLLINHTLKQHFFDFVNQYRIRRAKELLADPVNSKVTVLEILYEVGFNSKSSFNTTFKKFTGSTPTQYRQQSHTGST